MSTPGPAAAAPAFSVVIPTYDRAGTLRRAIDSVLAQSFADLEVLVVDDGSTDGTRELVEGLVDPRIRYLPQPHAGRSAARNRGAAEGRGNWLTFLDSDDEARPRWLERLAGPLRADEAPVACCGAHIVLHRPGETGREVVRLPQDLGAACFHRRGLFLAGTFALRRTLFLELGGYTEGLEFSENTELAVRLTLHLEERGLPLATVEEPLLVFHNRRPLAAPDRAAEHLHAARTLLELHGRRYRELDPRAYGRNRSIAAVAAARLEQWGEARRHLARGIRVWPWEPRQYLRMLLTLVPPAGRRVWRRHEEPL